MNLKSKLTELDIIAMQGQVDEIVFNHIDTSTNYAQAYKEIAPKLDEALQFLQRYLKEKGLETPPSNTYWVLYAGLVSKLAHFKAYTMWKLGRGSNEEIDRLFVVSAFVLPNKNTEVNEEVLEDMAVQYRAFKEEQGEETTINLHDEAIAQNFSQSQCLDYIIKYLI
ncbi:hypothetical protein [Caryophanon latum]|uniref:Uncharacterized protein n=1 Tax=Caryophanon latum TaxID=33977 RepID=A0A1C0Z5G4_9BACL|nr:hypothetical protein [Caryophanon latum]OCS94653.1 hypothetical protein A6K76_00335 [Caryophanon latum]